MTYLEWCKEQTESVKASVADYGKRGISNIAVYLVPGNGIDWGKLVVSTELPPTATDCLCWPDVGSRISSIPYSSMYSRIYELCRRMPVCGA